MKRLLFALVATAVLIGAPSGVFAQGASPIPYQGLFGGRDSDPNVRHRLDLDLSVAAAYDDDALPGIVGGIDPTTRPFSGYNNTYKGTIQYSYQGRRMQAGLSETSELRQYVDFNDYNMTHVAAAGVAMQFARRTSVFVNQTVAYSPPYLFGLFPSLEATTPGAAVVSGTSNYIVDNRESLSYETMATVEHGLTRRGTLAATADYRYTDFRNNATGRPDVSSSGIQARYGYGLGRNTAFTVGYHYRSGELGFGTTRVTSEQGLDVGMVYVKRLSPTRRATFNFNLGSTTMDLPDVPFEAIVGGRHSGVSGEAALNYQFSRSWLLTGSYRRGAEFVAELSEPVFADGVTMRLTGDLARRLHLMASGAYSSGETVHSTLSSGLVTYTGNLQLGYELTRSIGSFVEYLYYFYDFSDNPNLAPGLVSMVERNGVRAGLTVWFSMRRR